MSEIAKDPRIGTVLSDRYRVVEPIAQGSTGAVYRGEQIQLGKPVAIKFLRDLFLKDEYTRDRFVREAHAMSKLAHPHCVSVIDYGIEESMPYIVMDYVTGRSLDDIIRSEPMGFERAIRIALQILAGLAHAHSQGIIHRDIKPENIIINVAAGTGEQARIIDFSLAKMTDGNCQSLTGAILGTPAYMSPEQATADEVDARTDLYSVGIIIFELLTGQKPFLGEKVAETLHMQIQSAPPTLGEFVPGAAFSMGLEAVVKKALAKSRDERFSSAFEFMEALASVPESGNSGEIIDLKIRDRQIDHSAETIDFGQNLTEQPQGTLQSTVQATFPTDHPRSKKTTLSPRALALSGSLVLVLFLIVFIVKHWGSFRKETIKATGDPLSARTINSSAPSVVDVTKTPSDKSIRNAKNLINAGDFEGAISALQKLRASYPSAAEPPYLLGNLFSKKGWWSDAVERYEDAIALEPKYKEDSTLIQNLIRALSSNKAMQAASDFIVEQIGHYAIPHLNKALESEGSLRIRRRVAKILDRMSDAGQNTR